MTMQVSVLSAVAAGRTSEAAALVFEYMAATLAETGQAVPAEIGELPAVLERECRNLPSIYRAPGELLIAARGGQPCGCVGLARCSQERTAEIRRLYVRPDWRGNGIARTLMRHAHNHAGQHGMTRLILDVLPARTHVISFYRQLGYTETEPFITESPSPMIYMERPVTSDDVFYNDRS